MTIVKALSGREPSRLAVAIEMIGVCLGGIPLLVYVLARAQLPQPWPMVIGTLVTIVAIRIYVQALRLDTFSSD